MKKINENIFYNIEEVKNYYKNNHLTKHNPYQLNFLNSYLFRFRIFIKFYKDYINRTPESDSLYRRRNRLIVLLISGIFYIQTASGIFNRIEVEIFRRKKLFPIKLLFIPLSKTFYFLTCIFISQLIMKYFYYLNKVFKSTQFAFEGVLKYNIMNREYIYKGDEVSQRFDILDGESLKKNQ